MEAFDRDVLNDQNLEMSLSRKIDIDLAWQAT